MFSVAGIKNFPPQGVRGQVNSMESLQEQLQVLHNSYAARLPEKIGQIEETWEALVTGECNGEGLKALHRMVHSLAGSGPTFGFAAVGEAARTLEIFLKSILKNGTAPAEVHRTQIAELLTDLQQASLKPDQSPYNKLAAKTHSARNSKVSAKEDEEHLVFLLENDVTQARELGQQLGHFGYTVRIFDSPEHLKLAFSTTPPSAILIAIDFLQNGSVNAAAITELRQMCEMALPVLFLSEHDDLTVRLEAVRAGGDAYFFKPVDIGSLIDKLDLLTAHQAPEPFRVLIVDDEPSLADLYAFVLQQANMATVVVNRPLEVVQPLIDFRPDLILMDINMPDCNGLELATAIRQQEAYVSIPIVFISTETDLDRQLDAMRLGGDDSLTKPIQPDHLMSAVTSRAQRSRTLRSLMERDSLTGLFNHTKIKEQLDIEVSRAKRQDGGLALAMIDLDNFKSVNDRYGHPTGDRVLKSLARLLSQRLRKTDIIGRYGGEEFAVILHGANNESAFRVLDEIRQRFSLIRHHSEDHEFSVTFSCGVAVLPPSLDATELNAAADKMLYRAKHEGRNKTVIADAENSDSRDSEAAALEYSKRASD